MMYNGLGMTDGFSPMSSKGQWGGISHESDTRAKNSTPLSLIEVTQCVIAVWFECWLLFTQKDRWVLTRHRWMLPGRRMGVNLGARWCLARGWMVVIMPGQVSMRDLLSAAPVSITYTLAPLNPLQSPLSSNIKYSPSTLSEWWPMCDY